MTIYVFCPSRKKSSEGTYDLPHWDRTGMQPLTLTLTERRRLCLGLTELCCVSVLQTGGRA